MEIKAQIVEGIKYKPILKCNLTEVSIEDFNVNSAKSSCLILAEQNRFAISRWVSPKRTRSYPYERVYNTFSVSKRITIIPIIKDEGAAGDRDFLQWDTISLMSLLDVYVITAYYETAEKHRSRPDKITNQKFNNYFVKNKIKEISNYHSSALHWNLKELKNFSQALEKAKEAYRDIAMRTKVSFHSERGLEIFTASVAENLAVFMESSSSKHNRRRQENFSPFSQKKFLPHRQKLKLQSQIIWAANTFSRLMKSF